MVFKYHTTQTWNLNKRKNGCTVLRANTLSSSSLPPSLAAAITVDVALHPLSPAHACRDRLLKWPATCHAESANYKPKKINTYGPFQQTSCSAREENLPRKQGDPCRRVLQAGDVSTPERDKEFACELDKLSIRARERQQDQRGKELRRTWQSTQL